MAGEHAIAQQRPSQPRSTPASSSRSCRWPSRPPVSRWPCCASWVWSAPPRCGRRPPRPPTGSPRAAWVSSAGSRRSGTPPSGTAGSTETTSGPGVGGGQLRLRPEAPRRRRADRPRTRWRHEGLPCHRRRAPLAGPDAGWPARTGPRSSRCSTRRTPRSRLERALAAGECPQLPDQIEDVALTRALLRARVAALPE